MIIGHWLSGVAAAEGEGLGAGGAGAGAARQPRSQLQQNALHPPLPQQGVPEEPSRHIPPKAEPQQVDGCAASTVPFKKSADAAPTHRTMHNAEASAIDATLNPCSVLVGA